MHVLAGKGIAPGLANGCAVVLLDSLLTKENLPRADKETEILRLERDFQSAKADLEAFQAHVHQEFGASEAEIFAAHLLILDDPALRNDIVDRLNEAATHARDAIAASVEEFAGRMNQAQNPYLRERELDIRDIENCLIRHVTGHSSSRSSALAANSIIVAEELLPSDLLELDSEQLAGVVTERCGKTSHVAILARPNEAELNISSNLRGVGLLRTEFLFLEHSEPPSIEEQVDLYTT